MYRFCCYSRKEAYREAKEYIEDTEYRISENIGKLIVDDRCCVSDELDSRHPYGLNDTIVNCFIIVSDSPKETVAKIGFWCEESYEEACGIA